MGFRHRGLPENQSAVNRFCTFNTQVSNLLRIVTNPRVGAIILKSTKLL